MFSTLSKASARLTFRRASDRLRAYPLMGVVVGAGLVGACALGPGLGARLGQGWAPTVAVDGRPVAVLIGVLAAVAGAMSEPALRSLTLAPVQVLVSPCPPRRRTAALLCPAAVMAAVVAVAGLPTLHALVTALGGTGLDTAAAGAALAAASCAGVAAVGLLRGVARRQPAVAATAVAGCGGWALAAAASGQWSGLVGLLAVAVEGRATPAGLIAGVAAAGLLSCGWIAGIDHAGPALRPARHIPVPRRAAPAVAVVTVVATLRRREVRGHIVTAAVAATGAMVSSALLLNVDTVFALPFVVPVAALAAAALPLAAAGTFAGLADLDRLAPSRRRGRRLAVAGAGCLLALAVLVVVLAPAALIAGQPAAVARQAAMPVLAALAAAVLTAAVIPWRRHDGAALLVGVLVAALAALAVRAGISRVVPDPPAAQLLFAAAVVLAAAVLAVMAGSAGVPERRP